ncbi:tRNA (guanine(46)-N(7))-methyltransferase TrmB [Turneriella parva]|uniref:tRNA (guanine-N(7)-)-methyltransferase n=1 Tax=Turneriella parva (strain ATCC BAA-1111 / DSM 21527 / NCTC 11395 / H) TaxID=869212 RepID=I4B0R2_TURPD|nr:tRNA (guanine-N(7)-)-methyltransferase [Turneriella parva]AFM10869.1 tRNA (guanine-N(7)-)-methyltransferase [Turneriella parva DSM 21527]
MKLEAGSLALQAKLSAILAKKAKRAGEFALPFERDHFPLNVRHAFAGFDRFALEIGCGWGEFTRALAVQAPETMHIAVEKKLARVITSGKDQKRAGIANIRYLVLDVAWFFAGVFDTSQFDSITINFPDPWPKARHHKHRFISSDFVGELVRIAAERGRITFATDNYAYSREAMQAFEGEPRLKNIHGAYLAVSDIAGRPRSFFETLHRNEGALIYFLEYEKL